MSMHKMPQPGDYRDSEAYAEALKDHLRIVVQALREHEGASSFVIPLAPGSEAVIAVGNRDSIKALL